jgi:hypothetical protein
MNSMFMTELTILEHDGTGPFLMELKKKMFLEGAAAVIYDLAHIPEGVRNKDGKITPESIAEWAEKQFTAINLQLNEISAFELTFMLADILPKEKPKAEAKTQ